MATTDRDPTFRNYDSASAQKYLQHRPGYEAKLIDLIISHHTSSGGELNLVLDVGCGPGIATRSLAPHFQHAIGADPGQSMIETAKTVPCSTKSGEPITYEVSAAEALSGLSALKKFSTDGSGSVDLITAATAAHWFDMPRFWGEAAKILKPGGSVIFWCHGGYNVDPNSTPNGTKLQEWFKKFEQETIAPYELPGNKIARELYLNLGMPWECLDRLDGEDLGLKKLLDEFDEKEFVRLEFNKDGYVAPGETFFSGGIRVDFHRAKAMLGTASPITRWREANKEKVEKGELEDVIDHLIRRTKEIMEEVPEGKGRDWFDGGSALVVLVVKKRK
jgi:SAM-dependent methyltransferase